MKYAIINYKPNKEMKKMALAEMLLPYFYITCKFPLLVSLILVILGGYLLNKLEER